MSNAKNQKGKALEQWWLQQVKQVYLEAENIAKSKKRKSDVSFGNWITECKNTKNFSFKDAAEQVKRDSLGYRKESILWHPHATPMEKSVVIMNCLDFIELLKGERREMNDLDKIPKWELSKLREMLRKVEKYLGN